MESGRQESRLESCSGWYPDCKEEGTGYKGSVKLYTEAERLREAQCKARGVAFLVARRSQMYDRKGSFPFLSILQHSINCVFLRCTRQSVTPNTADYFSSLKLPLNVITLNMIALKAKGFLHL